MCVCSVCRTFLWHNAHVRMFTMLQTLYDQFYIYIIFLLFALVKVRLTGQKKATTERWKKKRERNNDIAKKKNKNKNWWVYHNIVNTYNATTLWSTSNIDRSETWQHGNVNILKVKYNNAIDKYIAIHLAIHLQKSRESSLQRTVGSAIENYKTKTHFHQTPIVRFYGALARSGIPF